MQSEIQIINPADEEGWNTLLRTSVQGSFYHSSNWAKVLAESYGYTPMYFTMVMHGVLKALIPVMEVNSWITGKRAVSLPFTDYCEPIMTENGLFPDLMEALLSQGRKAKWKSIELRPVNALPEQYLPASVYFGHALDIRRSEDDIFGELRDSTKRNIKKATKEGVEVTFSDSMDALNEFCRLNCITRKDHGLPPQPAVFFGKIHEHILSKGLGTVALAKHQGKYIAGAVYFHFGDQAFYKYGASDKAYQNIRANNLIMWEAIRSYRAKGYAGFQFGRTEPQNSGLRQFKTGWGAREYPIHYYKYDLRQNAFVKDALKLTGIHNRIFGNMPMPLLKIAGSMLYRHMG